MKATKEGENAKRRILKAAEYIFANKGFDGARVEEIARKAKVNKAMLYYYYESKEKILEALLTRDIDEIVDTKKKNLATLNTKDIKALSSKQVFDLTKVSLESFKEKNKIIKIALLEAMKDSKNNDALYKILRRVFVNYLPVFKEFGVDLDVDSDFLMTMFFFAVAPIILSTILSDSWIEFHSITREEFDKAFTNRVYDIYTKYILNYMYSKNKNNLTEKK